MAARPQVQIQSSQASKAQAALPAVFLAPIRPDLVRFVHTNIAKNRRQAYAVNKEAGHQTSAESWGTGRAVARIPRVPGGGTSRSGQGAFGNMCRGGRMFAPTKVWRKWHRKVNKNQRRYAVCSALAASALPALVMARGHRIESVPELPLVLANESVQGLSKTRDAVKLLQSVGAHDDVLHSKNSRKVRAGKGKWRNRRYTQRRGPLIVYGSKGPLLQAFRNLPGVELCHVSRLNLLQLAPGGHLGRFVVWTQDAFEALDGVFGTRTAASKQKSGFVLPRAPLANSDLARVINSDEIQSALKRKEETSRIFRARKRNPLKNFGALVKLNPAAPAIKRRQLLDEAKNQKRTEERAKKVKARRQERAKKRASKFTEMLLTK